jgi:hypothetical protein
MERLPGLRVLVSEHRLGWDVADAIIQPGPDSTIMFESGARRPLVSSGNVFYAEELALLQTEHFDPRRAGAHSRAAGLAGHRAGDAASAQLGLCVPSPEAAGGLPAAANLGGIDMTATVSIDWIEQFRSEYERYRRMAFRHRLPVSELCERRAHAALRAAVAAEPIRAFRVCGAKTSKACPWQYWDYVLVDIVPAKSPPGRGGALGERRCGAPLPQPGKGVAAGQRALPGAHELGHRRVAAPRDYDGVLFFNWLVKEAPAYCQRHPELATIASDLSAALALAELV